jgi:subtilisin-like proprotein convertase family protein
VSGVLALAKHVQPGLDTRWAKHLIVRTSQVVDENESSFASDGGWATNAAGNRYNQRYGFGVIDADALTQLAERSTGVSPLETEHTGTTQANVAIPDNDAQGVELPFTMNGMTTLEEIVITLDISHSYRGQLEAYVTSPSGTRSRLFARSEGVIEGFEIDVNRDGRPDNGDFNADIKNWKFTSNAFWGESPQGQWTLTVRDLFPGEKGTVNFYAAEARMGRLLSEAPRARDH